MISPDGVVGIPGPRCPTCGRRVTWRGNPARPFCSVGCKLIDLGGWLDERHRIASEEPPAAPAPDRRRTDDAG